MVELSLALKNYTTVIECTQKLLAQDPNELFALTFLGRAQALNGDIAGSKETFSRGLSLAQQAQDEENSTKVTNLTHQAMFRLVIQELSHTPAHANENSFSAIYCCACCLEKNCNP